LIVANFFLFNKKKPNLASPTVPGKTVGSEKGKAERDGWHQTHNNNTIIRLNILRGMGELD
jgi:hypothetical protein